MSTLHRKRPLKHFEGENIGMVGIMRFFYNLWTTETVPSSHQYFLNLQNLARINYKNSPATFHFFKHTFSTLRVIQSIRTVLILSQPHFLAILYFSPEFKSVTKWVQWFFLIFPVYIPPFASISCENAGRSCGATPEHVIICSLLQSNLYVISSI